MFLQYRTLFAEDISSVLKRHVWFGTRVIDVVFKGEMFDFFNFVNVSRQK